MAETGDGLAEVQERLEAAGVPEDDALQAALDVHERLKTGEDPEEVAEEMLERDRLQRRVEDKRQEDDIYRAL